MMTLAHEYVGTTIGNLHILDYRREYKPNYRLMFFIHCLLCDNERWMSYYSVKNPRVRGCGCKLRKDLENQKFGALTAKYPTKERKVRTIIWHCECECGKTAEVASSDLLDGSIRSCGCVYNDRRLRDLTGQTFGRLTALYPLEERLARKKEIIWHCKCSCGKTVQVRTASLTAGDTKSCGCISQELNPILGKQNSEKLLELCVEGTNLHLLDPAKIPSHNTSGVKGVYWERQTNKWRALIEFQGKRISLGRFKHKEDAILARKKAEDEYYQPMLEKHKDLLDQ